MNNITYAFILTSIAGASTLIGLLPIFFKVKNENKLISMSCSFASGIIISISMFDLMPESIHYIRERFSFIPTIIIVITSIFIGIILSMILDHYVEEKSSNNSLYKVGLLSMIAIILHNIPEGCSCYVSCWKYNIDLKFKNYQDNLYYYFGSLFNFYKHYFNSSSIICFILSMSVKNKFNPVFLLTIIYLKLSKISFFNTSTTFNGFPFNICGWSIYFSKIGKAFCSRIAESLLAIFLIIIVRQLPYF